jgi:hypothetical protein
MSKSILLFIKTPTQWEPWNFSLLVERPVCEADRSLPSSTKDKNAWSFTPNPSYIFIAKELFSRCAFLNILGAQSPVTLNWQYHTYKHAVVPPWYVVNRSLLLPFATHQFEDAVYVIEEVSD